jgi:hypothetical protein
MAPSRRNGRMSAGRRRQSKGNEALYGQSIENAALRGGQPKRLQRFPLVACEVAIEFYVHIAPEGVVSRGSYIGNMNWLRR